MKIAIMQPYLFPYLGYFQLIKAVDLFGIGDDVQYIKGGWINRNRILANKVPYTFTFSVKKDSYQKAIKERFFNDNFDLEKDKFLRILAMHYKKAPYYPDTIEVINSIFEFKEANVSKFIVNHLNILCQYLEIKTTFLDSSLWQIKGNSNMSVEEKAIKKLRKLNEIGINHFVNPSGGKELYNKDFFNKNNFKLSFLEPKNILYKQFGNVFHPSLSIIDVMMFNSKEEISSLLSDCNIV
jgi:hypothetical protein